MNNWIRLGKISVFSSPFLIYIQVNPVELNTLCRYDCISSQKFKGHSFWLSKLTFILAVTLNQFQKLETNQYRHRALQNLMLVHVGNQVRLSRPTRNQFSLLLIRRRMKWRPQKLSTWWVVLHLSYSFLLGWYVCLISRFSARLLDSVLILLVGVPY